MPRLTHGRATRLLGGSLLAIGLALGACSSTSMPNPAAPTPTPSTAAATQTITVTSEGVFPSVVYIPSGYPVMIVNADSATHQLHLDVSDEPGCAGFDLAGEIPAGESRTTGPITDEAVMCDGHDHEHHGDPRFTVQLVISAVY
jgi:hypothetical protein